MFRRLLYTTSFILLSGILPIVAQDRPNIIFIMSDDMGWAQPGFNGGNPELTPHIDKLAGEGMQLTQY